MKKFDIDLLFTLYFFINIFIKIIYSKYKKKQELYQSLFLKIISIMNICWFIYIASFSDKGCINLLPNSKAFSKLFLTLLKNIHIKIILILCVPLNFIWSTLNFFPLTLILGEIHFLFLLSHKHSHTYLKYSLKFLFQNFYFQ